jgi:hypothetical protein
MFAHRKNHFIVGWVMSCPNCADEIKGIELVDAKRITALETELKAAEGKLANSVPFGVLQKACEGSEDMQRRCPESDSKDCTVEACPLIPKGE